MSIRTNINKIFKNNKFYLKSLNEFKTSLSVGFIMLMVLLQSKIFWYLAFVLK